MRWPASQDAQEKPKKYSAPEPQGSEYLDTQQKIISGTSSPSINSCKYIKKMRKDLIKQEKEVNKKLKNLNEAMKKFEERKKEKEMKDRLTKTKLKLAYKNIEKSLNNKGHEKRYNLDNNNTKNKKEKMNKHKIIKGKFDIHKTLHNILCKLYDSEQKTQKPCNLRTCQFKDNHCMGNRQDSLFGNCFNHLVYRSWGSCQSPFGRSCSCRCSSTRSNAGDCFLMSLRNPPQLWMYDCWPNLYIPFLQARYQFHLMSQCCMLMLAAIFWLPCLLCLAILKCFFCACCNDCC